VQAAIKVSRVGKFNPYQFSERVEENERSARGQLVPYAKLSIRARSTHSPERKAAVRDISRLDGR
jgi:hypothetical protein